MYACAKLLFGACDKKIYFLSSQQFLNRLFLQEWKRRVVNCAETKLNSGVPNGPRIKQRGFPRFFFSVLFFSKQRTERINTACAEIVLGKKKKQVKKKQVTHSICVMLEETNEILVPRAVPDTLVLKYKR